jgi:hypothetical protein
MKDKELRTLLEEKGVIITRSSNGELLHHSLGFNRGDFKHLTREVNALDEENYILCGKYEMVLTMVELTAKHLRELQSKFDAVNKHYGIEVSKSESEYNVTTTK